MEFSDIERILALVKEHDLAEFELEREGLKIRVRKSGGVPTMFHAASPALPLLQATAAPQARASRAPPGLQGAGAAPGLAGGRSRGGGRSGGPTARRRRVARAGRRQVADR